MSRATALRLALLLAVCLPIYWLGLGRGGFHSTEAHRAIPAYEMLDHEGPAALDAWLVPHMFGQPYLRKPQGMPWAIAVASATLGRTEFAARAVSALCSTLMAVVAFAAARRWFGPRAALAAGLAQALMPVLWESGRAAEIEALNNLGAQIGALGILHLLVRVEPRLGPGPAEPIERPGLAGRVTPWLLAALAAAAGIVLLTVAKGPAAFPVVAGAVLAACFVRRSFAPAIGAIAPIAIALLPIIVLLRLTAAAIEHEPTPPIIQSPGVFLFEPGALAAVALLPLAAFAQTLPASLALLFPWGPDARRETERPDAPAGDRPPGPPLPDAHRMARALAWAWIAAIAIFTLAGVQNPRYTLPAAVLLPPLAGWVVSGVGAWLTPTRDRIARAMLLGRRWVLPAGLLIGAVGYIATIEASRRATSGEDAGRRAAALILEALPETGASDPLILADQMIEARPEVLLELRRALRAAGLSGARVRWVPALGAGRASPVRRDDLPPVAIAVLRADAEQDETGSIGPDDREIASGLECHKYRFNIYLLAKPE